MKPEKILALAILVALALVATPTSGQTPTIECQSAQARLGDDGSLEITESLTISSPPTEQENITIETVGTPVYAEARTSDGVLLPLNIGNGSINITLLPGTSAIRLYYVTLEATAKQGEKWILSFSSPCPITLIMPADAVPASMSPEPRITVVNGTVLFHFPPGSLRVEYFLAPDIGSGGGGAPGGGTGASPGTGNTGSTGSPGAPQGSTSGEGASKSRLVLAGAAAVAVAVAAWLLYRRRPRGVENAGIGVEAALLDERDKKIVEVLRGKPEGLTASELLEATGIPKTPLYRRLNRLARQGVIEYYDEGGVRRYRLREG